MQKLLPKGQTFKKHNEKQTGERSYTNVQQVWGKTAEGPFYNFVQD